MLFESGIMARNRAQAPQVLIHDRQQAVPATLLDALANRGPAPRAVTVHLAADTQEVFSRPDRLRHHQPGLPWPRVRRPPRARRGGLEWRSRRCCELWFERSS